MRTMAVGSIMLTKDLYSHVAGMGVINLGMKTRQNQAWVYWLFSPDATRWMGVPPRHICGEHSQWNSNFLQTKPITIKKINQRTILTEVKNKWKKSWYGETFNIKIKTYLKCLNASKGVVKTSESPLRTLDEIKSNLKTKIDVQRNIK